jgi:hypothetical protein
MTATKTLAEIFKVNGQTDDMEPWTAADDCEIIEINGEDILALAEDGVAIWDNSEREWREVPASDAAKIAMLVFGSGFRANSEKKRSQVETLLDHMSKTHPYADVPTHISVLSEVE